MGKPPGRRLPPHPPLLSGQYRPLHPRSAGHRYRRRQGTPHFPEIQGQRKGGTCIPVMPVGNRSGKVVVFEGKNLNLQENETVMPMNQIHLKQEAVRCLLCENAPCTAACANWCARPAPSAFPSAYLSGGWTRMVYK